MVWGVKGRRSHGLTWIEVHGYVLVTIFQLLLLPLLHPPSAAVVRISVQQELHGHPEPENRIVWGAGPHPLLRALVKQSFASLSWKGRIPAKDPPGSQRTGSQALCPGGAMYCCRQGETRDPHWRGGIRIPVHHRK